MSTAANNIVIMAGGLGKRMSSELPKVLHNLGNIPMLVRIVQQAMMLKPYKILIVVGKYKKIIEETLSKYVSLKNIVFIIQEQALGTGHAIMCCRDFLLSNKSDSVLILSGDTPLVKSSTMYNMLNPTTNVNVCVTVAEDPSGYGRIVETDGVFEKIVEEKDCSDEERKIKKINGGMYAFNNNLLCKYLPYLTNNNAQKEYYLTDMIQIIKEHEQVAIGTHEISKNQQYEIRGVNTKKQLTDLEQYITPLSFEDRGRMDQWCL